MSIPWTKVIGGVVSLAGIVAGGAFGKKVLDRIGSVEDTIVTVADMAVRQADRAVEALPWERQLRMMDALITDCDAVPVAQRGDCADAREKLRGQLEMMRRAMGLPQTPLGEWEVSVWIEHSSRKPFALPPAAIVDVQLPNLSISDPNFLAAAVEVELGSATSAIAHTPSSVEVRRPLTNLEADSLVRGAATEILRAILQPDLESVHISYSSSMPLRTSVAVQQCLQSRGPFRSRGLVPNPERVRAQAECTYQVTEEAVREAFLRAVSAYNTTVPYPGGANVGSVTGSAYRIVRPYNPYGPRAHTILAMDLAALRELGPESDSLQITMAVHRSGSPDELYPGAQRQTFSGSSLIRSPEISWTLDRRGVAWIGHGLVPRDAPPVTSAELRQIREDAISLAAEVHRKYGRVGQ